VEILTQELKLFIITSSFIWRWTNSGICTSILWTRPWNRPG